MFVTPVKGAKAVKAAQEAGFGKPQNIHSVRIEGGEHVPRSGPGLLVANHAGALPYDTLMLPMAVAIDTPAARPVRPLVEDFLFHFPFLGPLLNRVGGVHAGPDNAERLLADGQLVAVFPEGTTHDDPSIRPLRTGVARIALAAGDVVAASQMLATDQSPRGRLLRLVARLRGDIYSPQEVIERARAIEAGKLLKAADVAVADEDLRDRGAAGGLRHLGAPRRHVVDLHLLDRDPAKLQ